jgi:hypothetical protein
MEFAAKNKNKIKITKILFISSVETRVPGEKPLQA